MGVIVRQGNRPEVSCPKGSCPRTVVSLILYNTIRYFYSQPFAGHTYPFRERGLVVYIFLCVSGRGRGGGGDASPSLLSFVESSWSVPHPTSLNCSLEEIRLETGTNNHTVTPRLCHYTTSNILCGPRPVHSSISDPNAYRKCSYLGLGYFGER